jgi:hypothetical protein
MAAVRANRNKLRRTIQKAKRDWAYEFTSNIDPADIWKLNSWYRGNRRYTMPTLKDPKGKTAISTTEKTNLFMESFFPPPPILNKPLANFEEYNPNARQLDDVTEEEVERHLKKTSDKSSPEILGISYRALKWAWEVASELITYILDWSLKLGIHHDSWKTAITVVIPKPNKKDYMNPRSYRPIQLLECLGKLLEKIVAKRLSFDCHQTNSAGSLRHPAPMRQW